MRPVAFVGAVILVMAISVPQIGQGGPGPGRIVLGMVPFRETGRMLEDLRPLSRMLAERTGLPVEAFVATNYTGLIEAMGAGKVDVGIFGPFALVLAEERHRVKVIVKAVRRTRGRLVTSYQAAINVRVDSGITSLKDLQGKRVAFVDPASTSGYLFPYTMLLDARINPDRDLKTIFVGSHDAAIIAVYKRDVDASATHDNAIPPVAREFPDVERVVKILVRSGPIPNDGVAVRRDLPDEVTGRIQTAFIDLGKTPEAVKLLSSLYNVVGYARATPEDFEIVRKTYRVLRDRIKI